MNIYLSCWLVLGFWFFVSMLCKGKITGDDKEDKENGRA